MNREIIWEADTNRFYPKLGVPEKGRIYMVDEFTARRFVNEKLASYPKVTKSKSKKEVT